MITDVAGLLVGNAEDPDLKSGVTVLTSDQPFTAAVHVMGGAPGTRETDLLAPDKSVTQIDALVLSGGSAFGLAAAQGVADALRQQGRGFQVGDQNVPIVPAAILFDLLNGGDKNWTDNPYPALGHAALTAANPDLRIGTVGAGTGATTATLKGGLGSASCVLPTGETVGALVAVNAMGSVIMGKGPQFWAAPYEQDDEYGNLGIGTPTDQVDLKTHSQNTTIGIVATDATLDKSALTRMATAAHDGIARAVLPAHTPMDGDLIFAASTGQKPTKDPLMLGHAAATCMARAIARGVYMARSAPSDTAPTWHDKFS